MLVTGLHPLSHPGRHILNNGNGTNEQDTQYKPCKPAIKATDKGHDKRRPDMGKGFYHGPYADDRCQYRKEMD